jgi:hypothetical protein
MKSKETTGDERMPSEKQPMIERIIMYLQKEESLKKLHHYVMDPLLNHILERVFPYIVLTCVLFGLLLILAMCTFAAVVLQMKNASSLPNVFAPMVGDGAR